jgi:hypothetical protein
VSTSYSPEARAQAYAATEPREAECLCHQCYEGVYHVPGVSGPQRWLHVRTGSWICDPRCQTCGKRGEVKIGTYEMVSGFLTFVHSHWECGACSLQTLRIEHT